MHTRILATVPALALLLGLPACDRHEKSHEGQTKQKKMALKLPEGTPNKPTGMAALDMSNAAGAFSASALTAYFKTHNLPMNMGNAADIHVDNVEFMTDHELGARLDGVSTGLGADAKVVLVSLSGLFVFTGPPKSRIARFSHAYAVFDAATGNLMLAGVRGEKTEQQPTAPR
jgi:hypothetical protein